MSDRRRPEPSDLRPSQAVERYLRRRRADATEESIEGWSYRLKLFVEWCDSIGIETVGGLRRYDLDEYYEYRSADIKPVTLEGEMWTLRVFMEFLEDIGAVEDGLSDSVRIPDIDPSERSSNTKLDADDARRLLTHYRQSEDQYGTRQHAFLELAWYTGARQGSIRGLDVRDAYLNGSPYVMFRHRPETGTPLKNKLEGERPVALPEPVGDVLRTYIARYRYDSRDDHGRQPLIASAQGRPTANTVRIWSYLATLPCNYGVCPHEKEIPACQWTERAHASKCPSSRAPHHIRTGTITWLLNIGWPPQDVAERVNATRKTIEEHYDKATPAERRERRRERMEDRRRSLVESLDFEDDD
ncbi:tyrosine-type recombinase/integrase [Haloarcula pellucida]|uniref:Integrase n=1 Tax=Haloarcula pellucida TaxID=1427151 RepID=A0A830GKZ0_9EURY|nr:tyrosine-type recombinase/integrase [Halomicroarcula pellucida]MBX0348658.1 site-specific integrase [Halomicroarcula pellucida]GGN92350.1 integrase [Halomicroarcula pellucida]